MAHIHPDNISQGCRKYGLWSYLLPSYLTVNNIKLLSYFIFLFSIYQLLIIIVIIQLFVYLRADLNSQWQITESTRIQTTTAIRQHMYKRKLYQLIMFKFQLEFLKMSVYLQAPLATELHLAEG